MKTFFAGCVVLLLATSVARAELISNGTFETPVAPSTSGWLGFAPGSTALTGWTIGTVTGATKAAAQGVQIINNAISVSNNMPHDGTQILQLGQYDTISQTIATVSGYTYTISIDLAARDSTTSNITVLFGDTSDSIVATNKTAFTTFTFTAKATSSSTLLTIEDMTAQGTGAYSRILLDNVSVTIASVPEPGTLALLDAGLFGLLCYAWRKRK